MSQNIQSTLPSKANEKLSAFQNFAKDLEPSIRNIFGDRWAGGRLLTGTHYGYADTLFLGYNPGTIHDGVDNEVNLRLNLGSPLDTWSNYRYWRNCATFLRAAQLEEWFNTKVTSAFASPWRTPNLSTLYALNRRSQGLLFRNSGELLSRMIDDHDARRIVITGSWGTSLLVDVLYAPSQRRCGVDSEKVAELKSGHCSEATLTLNSRPIQVLQVPHFSQRGSTDWLEPAAHWLATRLRQVA